MPVGGMAATTMGSPLKRILLHEETLDPNFLPPDLVHRTEELTRLTKRYSESLAKGVSFHIQINGGIGSGKTALAKRLGTDLERRSRIGPAGAKMVYINAWRRASDRTVALDLLRAVDVSLPDRGYSLAEMLDVFEQGVRRHPRHYLIILDEAGALVRQGTKLVYLLSRSGEVGLGTISLILISPDDVLPFLDPASRSSFGVTHRIALAPYDRAALTDILLARAELALRPGSFDLPALEQIARIAAPSGDARFALELLAGAAHAAESMDREAVTSEDVRAAKGSIYPTVTESQLEGLSTNALTVLLALARSLKRRGTSVSSQKLRSTHESLLEEFGQGAISRTTFWRTLQELDRAGLVALETGESGTSAEVSMDELPASYLSTLIEERLGRGARRKA
jgi:cell division control protein 6